MKRIWKRPYKIIATVLAVILIVQMLMFSMGSALWFSKTNAEGASESETEEMRIAAEISNMTGVPVERILSRRASGQSWNDIMEQLKYEDKLYLPDGKEERSLLLMQSGLSEDTINQLLADGFDQDEITNAKLLAERVAYQLQELVESPAAVKPNPTDVLPGDNQTDEDLSPFRDVAERFEIDEAVRWMFVLREQFGAMETVLDEYLVALQYGLNLEDYLTDRDQYLLEKERKRLEMSHKIQVSLVEIENRLLSKIQQENENQREESPFVRNDKSAETVEKERILPDIPAPKPEDVKPANPADALLKEIEILNPNDDQY